MHPVSNIDMMGLAVTIVICAACLIVTILISAERIVTAIEKLKKDTP